MQHQFLNVPIVNVRNCAQRLYIPCWLSSVCNSDEVCLMVKRSLQEAMKFGLRSYNIQTRKFGSILRRLTLS